jgi:mannose-6-phosphate isomerase-like protein (cupin superfamily)
MSNSLKDGLTMNGAKSRQPGSGITAGVTAGISAGHSEPEYWFDEGCFITEWMNNDSNPDMSVAHARVPAGTTTRWHALRDTVERYVILSGSGRVELAGGAPQRVVSGDCVTITPGMPQRITADASQDLLFLAVCTPRFLPSNYQDLASAPPPAA